MFKKLCFTILVLFACGTAYAAAVEDLKIGTTKAGVKVTVDRVVVEGMALVSVEDAKKQPLLGLATDDFTVNQGDKKGESFPFSRFTR